MLVLNAPVIFVPPFLFQNLTFLNINISSHHYEYPHAIFLNVSNESHPFGSSLCYLYFVISVLYIDSKDSFPTSLSRINVVSCRNVCIGEAGLSTLLARKFGR